MDPVEEVLRSHLISIPLEDPIPPHWISWKRSEWDSKDYSSEIFEKIRQLMRRRPDVFILDEGLPLLES